MNERPVIPAAIMGPIYQEWIVDREVSKMERTEKRSRTRLDVLSSMREHNQKPLPICKRCDHVCIQRQVVGLISFKCEKRRWK